MIAATLSDVRGEANRLGGPDRWTHSRGACHRGVSIPDTALPCFPNPLHAQVKRRKRMRGLRARPLRRPDFRPGAIFLLLFISVSVSLASGFD